MLFFILFAPAMRVQSACVSFTLRCSEFWVSGRQDGGPRESRMMGRAFDDSTGAKTALQIHVATALPPDCKSNRHLIADWPDE